MTSEGAFQPELFYDSVIQLPLTQLQKHDSNQQASISSKLPLVWDTLVSSRLGIIATG